MMNDDKLDTYYAQRNSNKVARIKENATFNNFIAAIFVIAAMFAASISEPSDANAKCTQHRGGDRVDCRVK